MIFFCKNNTSFCHGNCDKCIEEDEKYKRECKRLIDLSLKLKNQED